MPAGGETPRTRASQQPPTAQRQMLQDEPGSIATEPCPAPGDNLRVPHAPFSISSSLLTMVTIIASFAVLCTIASYASTNFALAAARPVYGLYPSLVAAMLVGGVCALIYYIPTMLAVVCFMYLFHIDIRKGGAPPPSMQRPVPAAQYRDLARSLLHDGADIVKVALIVAPLYVMAFGSSSHFLVESRSLEAAAGGQLVAAVMTLRIMLVGMKEIWSVVPLVVFRWDRQARR